MYRVPTPEAVALLVQLRNAKPRVPDDEATEAASEQKVPIVIPALGQGLLDVLLEPRLGPVGSVLQVGAATRIHIPRQRCQEALLLGCGQCCGFMIRDPVFFYPWIPDPDSGSGLEKKIRIRDPG
jgi:hypothetical protein